MRKYVILPSSSDLNRGDQALVWETIEIAKKGKRVGEYYMLASELNRTKQSQEAGIKILSPILKHPSRMFKSKENNEYNNILLFKWGMVAIFDFIFSLLILSPPLRYILKHIMSTEDRRTLQVIEESEACFVKGGGFIHSAGRITDSYIVYYQLFHIMLAQSMRKPVYVMPNSFGPFPGFGVKWLVTKTLNNCELVTVRESISKSMLDGIDVKSEIFPDLGFSLDKNRRKNKELLNIRSKYPGKRLVAITARPYRFPNSENPNKKYKEYISGMANFSRWLFENKYVPVFIEHTLSETTHENDGNAIAEITAKLDIGSYEVLANDDYNCRDLKSIYSEMDFVVGTRFHSVIFSLAENIPSIAITYGGNKGQGIMKDLGLSDYALSMSEFDLNQIIHMFNNLVENSESVREQLVEINKVIKIKHNDLSLSIS